MKNLSKKLGFGCMRLPIFDGDVSKIDKDHFCKMIDYFIENGFCYFDTAYPYHQEKSEETVRECLVKRYNRDDFYIADKFPAWLAKDRDDCNRLFNEQLNRCGIEYFDYYLIHAMDDERYNDINKYNLFDYLNKKKSDGLIKNFGFSFHDTADVLDKILSEHPEVDFVQLQINYYDWDSDNVQSRECYEVACKHNKPVIVMEPVKGGLLANLPNEASKYFDELHNDYSNASYAIRYVASLDNVFMVLSGMSNMEQLENNVSYMKDFKKLEDNEINAVNNVVDTMKKIPTIACTGCRYCVDGCPQSIEIPKLFSIYNQSMQFGLNDLTKFKYENESKGNNASKCIKCGKCEKMCPQHLEIRGLLEKVAERFE